jgi:hypothetical protein
MLPNRLLVSTYLGRHLRLWALIRIGLSGVFLLARTDPLRVTPWTLCAIVALCAVVSVVELRRRHERVLLGNLGVNAVALGVLLIVPPLAGELVVRALAAPGR